MPTDTVSIDEFLAENKIRMSAQRWHENPNMEDFQGDHWKCVLIGPGKRMTVYFSMGYGHKGEAPEAGDVLDCLASDACGAEDSFEEWASNLGYDSDSREAEKTFKAVQHATKRLKNFLGEYRFEQLLYHVEKL